MTATGRGLDDATVAAIADELAAATASGGTIDKISVRYPQMTVEDSYAVQRIWRDRRITDGHRIVGRKIGLTSKAMQQATGITEPDYGVIFDDQVFESGAEIPFGKYSNVRVEVELAFVLNAALSGPGCTVEDVLAATESVVPALEILDAHIELAGRTIVDTISDNAALGAMVLGPRQFRVDEVDLRWVGALMQQNGEITESGVSGAVLGHPATGVAWLANKLAAHGDRLEAGEIILAGSFTRPVWISAGDEVVCEYQGMGEVTCRFV
ncbi:2-keto-4-pentenoate hydratase [Tsukamurella soli]|uniref:2-keto-4-pentenoate hydratase n=1 Tax=Tsukamurella soli TaxID=644556 RepID=UPI003616133E